MPDLIGPLSALGFLVWPGRTRWGKEGQGLKNTERFTGKENPGASSTTDQGKVSESYYINLPESNSVRKDKLTVIW